jgi:SPP1 family predicted phage head-tail adaptor
MDRWPSIDPGDMRHRIMIEQAVESQGANGALLQSWTTYARAWARIDPYGGGEKWADASLAATNMFKLRMRYCPGLTTRMRIIHDNRVFDIKNVEDVLERKIVHILTCLERLYDEIGARVQ